MSDELKVSLILRNTDSAPKLSPTRIDLVARGRRDADAMASQNTAADIMAELKIGLERRKMMSTGEIEAEEQAKLAEDQRLAEWGDVNAQGRLASRYYSGNGVPQDYVEAAQWYRKAAERGEPTAQYMVGTLYREGLGVSQDVNVAVYWFRQSAAQDYDEACWDLADMYYYGKGVAQDYSEAVNWIRIDAERRGGKGLLSGFSQYRLAMCYYQGRGVPQNHSEAAVWARKAAENGNDWGQYLLGHLCAYGQGISRSAVTGYMWMTLAIANDSGEEEDRKYFLTGAVTSSV